MKTFFKYKTGEDNLNTAANQRITEKCRNTTNVKHTCKWNKNSNLTRKLGHDW